MDAVICAEEEDEKDGIGEVEGREVDGRRKLCQHIVFRVRQCSFPSL